MEPLGDAQEFQREILHVGDDVLDPAEEVVVGDDRGHGGEEADGRGHEGLGDARGDDLEAGRAHGPDADEGDHDAPDRAEEADERRDAAGRGQEEHHLLQPRHLGVRGLEEGPAEALGLRAGPAALARGLRLVGQLLVAGEEDDGQRAGPEPLGGLVDLAQALAPAEGLEEPFGLLDRGLDGLGFIEDDGPGKDGEKDEEQEDQLDDDVGFGDDLENVDIHDYPRKK